MIEYEMDKIETCAAPPTREAIEDIRQKQLRALQALRRQLLDVLDDHKSAA